MDSFSPCPLVLLASSADTRRFWAEFSARPRPVRIATTNEPPIDFVKSRGVELLGGAFQFGDLTVGPPPSYSPYMLSNPAYTPLAFERLDTEYPLPEALSSIALRPVLSIGMNGTGERDLAHHYHPITAMRLLQGRKIWALREPTDAECSGARGTCTDPFLVCDYYARPSAPAPACVQEAGDTIIVPDGWYHGTCNNASLTVGWGGQGRRVAYTAPRCFHCRHAGQLRYASTDDEVVTAHDANQIGVALQQLRRPAGQSFDTDYRHLGRVGQSAYMAFRSIFNQFVLQMPMEQEQNRELREPACKLRSVASIRADRATARQGSVKSSGPVSVGHMLLPLRGSPLSVLLQHPASGESELRKIPPRHAVFWVDEALVSVAVEELQAQRPEVPVTAGEDGALVLVECSVPMPLSTTSPNR
jgi:hypothetical protein